MDQYAFYKSESDNIENLIQNILIRYWRWHTEGCPKDQDYYDEYQHIIEFIGESIYAFHIQISNLSLIRGKFRIINFCDIEIIEQFIITK